MLLLYWAITAAVLWWSYDFGPFIRGGHYEFDQALRLVCKMAAVVSILTFIAWLLVKPHRFKSPLAAGMGAGWRTALLLAFYAFVILANIQFGNYQVPLPDSAFLPVIGHLNSYFFSEVGWLVFMTMVIPIMTVLSAALYVLQWRISRVPATEQELIT
jgi:hypothetical protein